jgi:hypothetical protein
MTLVFSFPFEEQTNIALLQKKQLRQYVFHFVTKVQNVLYLFHNPSHVILDLVALMFNEVKGLL